MMNFSKGFILKSTKIVNVGNEKLTVEVFESTDNENRFKEYMRVSKEGISVDDYLDGKNHENVERDLINKIIFK